MGSWSERRLVLRRSASHQRRPNFCQPQKRKTTDVVVAPMRANREVSQGCLNQSRTPVILVSFQSTTDFHLV